MVFIGSFMMLLAVVTILGLLAGTFVGVVTQHPTNNVSPSEINTDLEANANVSENTGHAQQLVQATALSDEEQKRRENELDERNRLHALHEVSAETIPYDDSYMTSMDASVAPWDVSPA